MNFKKSLLITILCTTPLLGKPPKKSSISDLTVNETISTKKTNHKTYYWLAAAGVGLAGTLYLYRQYNNYYFLKTRFANLLKALETYKELIDVTCHNESNLKNDQIRDLQDVLIKNYKDKAPELEALRKALPALKAQFTKEQQEVMTTVIERGEEGHKELDEAFPQISIYNLYNNLLTTFDRLEERIPHVQNVLLLEKNKTTIDALYKKYDSYFSAKGTDELCMRLISAFRKVPYGLKAFSKQLISHQQQLNKAHKTARATLENRPELHAIYSEYTNQHAPLAIDNLLNSLLQQIPYATAALLLDDNSSIFTTTSNYQDKWELKKTVSKEFKDKDYPFIELHNYLKKEISEVTTLTKKLHPYTDFQTTIAKQLEDRLVDLKNFSEEVQSSQFYKDDVTAYNKEQERLREIRLEKERRREEKRKRAYRKEQQELETLRLAYEMQRLANETAQLRINQQKETKRRTTTYSTNHTPNSSIFHSNIVETPSWQPYSRPTTYRAPKPPTRVQRRVKIPDAAGRYPNNGINITAAFAKKFYSTPQTKKIFNKIKI